MKFLPEYAVNVIVATLFKSIWRWLVIPIEEVYLDLEKLEKAYRKKYPDYSLSYYNSNLRYGITILNQNTFEQYLKHIDACIVTTQELREYMIKVRHNSKNTDLLDIRPFFFINFDDRFFSSSFPEPGSFESYIPDEWNSKYENNIDHYIPDKYRFWIFNGKDMFSL